MATVAEEIESRLRAVGTAKRDGQAASRRGCRLLAPRTHRSSGMTMREAVKYLPPVVAASTMEAYRAGLPAA